MDEAPPRIRPGEDEDKVWMRLCLDLARRGAGRTSPNPRVGAVVVREGRMVGWGWHRRAGLPHAEAEALRRAGSRARGGTLYVNLEPCSHWGRTPPCAESIVRSGIARVVAGMVDPNPLVRGRGFRLLRAAGVEVRRGLLEEECAALNEGFLTWVTEGRPFVTLKLALSLDGRLGFPPGGPRWLTGPEARREVHRMRDTMDAVLVGVGTVLADDPRLTCRIPGGRDPLRVVLDGGLRTPPAARLLRVRRGAPAPVLYSRRGAPLSRRRALEARGAEVVPLPSGRGGLRLTGALADLARRGVTSLLVEGGGDVASSFLEAGLVDRFVVYLAPRVLGDGPRFEPPAGGGSFPFRWEGAERIGADLKLTLAGRP